ncbi:UNVERIFIED_CONTAM: hypothetical protein RMT77_003510 [Armadillidium vulgare]
MHVDVVEEAIPEPVTPRYVPIQSSNLESTETQRKRGLKLKKAWQMLKEVALEKVCKKIEVSVQTSRTETNNVSTQTEYVDLGLSPIEVDNYVDWFDVESINSDEGDSFDIHKFEKSLCFPENSYTLGTGVGDLSSASEDASINQMVKELGMAHTEESNQSIGVYSFLDSLKTPEDKVTTSEDELRKVRNRMEQHQKTEDRKEDHYSPPKTRSRGSVPEISNVQEKVLEYEKRTEAKRRASFGH